MCVQIDCLFLMPGFEYGSDFEIKFQVWVIMLISDGSVVCLFRIAKQAVRGGEERGGRMKKARRLPRFFS